MEEHEKVRKSIRKPNCRKGSSVKAEGGLFDDGDTLLIFGIIIILMREKADQKLLFALLLAMIM